MGCDFCGRDDGDGRAVGGLRSEDGLDIYLTDSTCWRNVPVPVWEYMIDGKQGSKRGKRTERTQR